MKQLILGMVMMLMAATSAFGASGKISDMTQTNSLAPTLTLFETSVPNGSGGYVTRSITFSNLMNAFKVLGFADGLTNITVSATTTNDGARFLSQAGVLGTTVNSNAHVHARGTTVSGIPLQITPLTGGTNNSFQVNGTNGTPAMWLNTNAQIQVPNGSSTLPSYAWANDPTSGQYIPAAGTLSFAVTAAERLRISTTDLRLRNTLILGFSSGAPNLASDASMIRDATGAIGLTNDLRLNGSLLVSSNLFLRAHPTTNVLGEVAANTNFVVNFNVREVEIPSSAITNGMFIAHGTNGPANGTGTNATTIFTIQTGNTNRHVILGADWTGHVYETNTLAFLFPSNQYVRLEFIKTTGVFGNHVWMNRPRVTQ